MATRIWIPHPTQSWVAAQVVSSDANSVTVRVEGRDSTIPGALAKFDAIAPGALEEYCDNLVDLENFNEGIILHHTRARFQQDVIYTFVGTILIALNPYKPLAIYDVEGMDRMLNAVKRNETVPPHIFAIGAAALHNLRTEGKDQSVLISGESGAGKTEATKKILQFLSTMSGSTASRVGVSVENQILDSNPLLEGFGNAKTIRNNNSSRFGKYMKVNFDRRNNIKGCNVVAYLLEKSRVVRQTPNERNYHAFYMLLGGASKEMMTEWGLRPAGSFYYLAQSGCESIPNRDERREFEELCEAMNSLNIDVSIRRQIFQSLAAILHLGNLEFAPRSGSGGDGCQVTNGSECKRVASLLGINADGLELALCFKETTVRNETTLSPLDMNQAKDQRDALAKYAYGKIFDVIVAQVNSSLFRGSSGNSIGVLDIFGFEVFKVNSFEQLCINYCNERLQTFFNEVIFKGEMTMYASENIPCDDIKYQDNLECVNLIDSKGCSIFAFLDNANALSQHSDDKLVDQLHTTFDDSQKTKSLYYGRNRKAPREFIVRHFAGDVAYCITDFLEKNKDTLAPKLFSEMQNSTLTIMRDAPVVDGDSGAAGGGPASDAAVSGKARGGKLTLSAKFKRDLDDLMESLRSTFPHFVRCVKPNDFQQSNRFDPPLALNQLKYSGLFEAIRIRKAGYSVRLTHQQFVKRYGLCAPSIPAQERVDPSVHCASILKILAARVHQENDGQQRKWFVGNTRVFLRTQQFKYLLDADREQYIGIAAIPIQRIIRGFLGRRLCLKMMGPLLQLKEVDKRIQKREIAEMEREDALTMSLEMIVRNDKDLQRVLAEARQERIRVELERQRLRLNKAATNIQRIFRGKVTRVRGRVFMCEEMFRRAFSLRDENMIRTALMMPTLLGVTSKVIKAFQQDGKELVLEVLHETFVKNQLEDAIRSGCVDLLENAIALAEKCNMHYLSSLKEAKKSLTNVHHLRSILGTLEGVLSRCVSIPKLISRVDELRRLVNEATELGLGGEYLVADAILRLKRVTTLVTVRDKIRFAVEICSMNAMNEAMAERATLLKIYGDELFGLEAEAVAGMKRMFEHESQMIALGSEGAAETGFTPYSMANDDDDVRLPPFVMQQLETMRNAKSMKDLNAAMDEFATLIPNEPRRKAYVRVFKWVVAFATWRFTKTPEEELAHEQHRKVLAAAAVAENTRRTMASMRLEDTAEPKGRSQTQEAKSPVKTPKKGSPRHTNDSKNASSSSDLEPNRTATSPKFPTQRMADSAEKLSRKPVARATSSQSLPPQFSRAEGLSSKLSPGYSFGPSTMTKPKKREEGSASSSTTLFSQRQSKAEVAAYIALKRAQKLNPAAGAQSDKTFSATMHDYDMYWKKTKQLSGKTSF